VAKVKAMRSEPDRKRMSDKCKVKDLEQVRESLCLSWMWCCGEQSDGLRYCA
jgi:hypothetical protein